MKHCCPDMQYMVEEENNSIIFVPQYREYGVPIRDGGSSYLLVKFCPWCGAKLPDSLRNEFFDILEKLGIDYPCPKNKLPKAMRSEKWWQEDEKYDPPESSQSSAPGEK